MLKNRNIPFGYCMINGKFAVKENEAEAVRKIFSDYIDGKSLKTIASEMKIPYNTGKEVWNKNMVCRVLENSKYLGENGYPNINGSVEAAQQRIEKLSHNIDELIKLATVPETASSAMTDIAKFSEEMKALREFIKAEKAKQAGVEQSNNQLDAVIKRLENEDFTMTEYDDVAVRQLIEKITVGNKNTIIITFKGGFEVKKGLDSGN